MDVRRGLIVDRYHLGSRGNHIIQMVLWMVNHHVHIKHHFRCLFHSPYLVWPEGNVRDEVAVHHIHMQDSRVFTFQKFNLIL